MPEKHYTRREGGPGASHENSKTSEVEASRQAETSIILSRVTPNVTLPARAVATAVSTRDRPALCKAGRRCRTRGEGSAPGMALRQRGSDIHAARRRARVSERFWVR
jgi:hypothetical protein